MVVLLSNIRLFPLSVIKNDPLRLILLLELSCLNFMQKSSSNFTIMPCNPTLSSNVGESRTHQPLLRGKITIFWKLEP